MTRPARDTTAGRVYLDLRRKARAEARGTDELLVLYVLERFLYRLSISEFRDRFVLKGGMLLAAFDERRPTRDAPDLSPPSFGSHLHALASPRCEIVRPEVEQRRSGQKRPRPSEGQEAGCRGRQREVAATTPRSTHRRGHTR
jgi:hypothetical protein